jgi:PAS domain S-box-containing protein
MHAALWPAIRQDLVERLEGSYRFLHDRVQEAAYSLIPEASRADVHLRIGRLLVAQTPLEKREEAIFEIVGQLNRGAALITEQEERDQLAELNLIAGSRAKASTAYASALAYLGAGAALLAEDSRGRRHELAFALELRRAECEFLTGQVLAADERLAALSNRASTIVEQGLVACLHIDVCTTLNQSGRAVAVCLDYLRHVGIEWSPHPQDMDVRHEYERIWPVLGCRTIEHLIDCPQMEDAASLATVEVLSKLSPTAVYTDANLAAMTICKAVSLSLERGNCDASSFAYVMLAQIAGPRFGDYQAGFRFGQLGYKLVERRGLQRFEASTYLCFAMFVVRWTKHVRASRDLLRRAFEAAHRIGDLTFGAYTCNTLNTDLFFAGEPLPEVQGEAEHGLAFAEQARFGLVVDCVTTQLALIRMLRGLTPKFGCFDDAQFNELRIEYHLSSNPTLAIAACWYWIRKLQARYFAGDYAAAIDAASKAQQLLWTSTALLEEAEYHFYGALAKAAHADFAPGGERRQHLDAVAVHLKQLEVWAENCSENFENRAALVRAELARAEGRDLDAMRLYEQAVRSARNNGFSHNEALANELASCFYAVRGFEDIAHLYLRKARYGYLRWGADGKVRQLEEMYPHLRTEECAPGPTSTIATPVEQLDLATVVKVSQAVSGEIVLERLIDMLMRTAIEQAGAERGLLVLSGVPEPRIEAEAMAGGGDTVVVQLRQASVTADALPESVLHYVLRTHESVILDDAKAESLFAEDPYVRQRQARSVLCLPLINQGKLSGVLYLENNLTPRAFAPGRIAVLKLLASQAAISLENTRLYRDLEQREAKIRRLVDANIIGVFVADLEGRIIEANDEFLRIVGYEREYLIAGRMHVIDMTPLEWRDRTRQTMTEIGLQQTVQPYEKEYFRKDGSRVPVLVGSTLFDESNLGVPLGVVFVVNMTERKRAEDGLRASEELKRRIIESSTDCIKVLDLDGNLLFMSSGGQQLLEIDNIQPYLNSCWIDFWQPEDRPKIREAVAAARSGGIGTFQAFCPSAKGAPRWWDVIVTPICNADGQPEQVLSVSRDITERKRAETEARESERRHREMQTELAHANRVATMGRLTASIAHEVNQPIAATVTNAQAALRFLDAPSVDMSEVRQIFNDIVKDGNRAGEVISRIRGHIKKAPPRRERLEINAAIGEVIELIHGEAVKNSVSVRTELADGLPLIQGDRVQLQQVLLNLMVNAIEAMNDLGEGERELLIGSATIESGSVHVVVRDTGPGLAPAVFDRVFQSFYTTKPSGLGLGLSICRSIVEAHGGRLWASANRPRGAVFQFTLPADEGM